ncbi:B3 domain-containing transcription repressor VAL2, partial [Mucuna pruriens]
MSQGTSPSRSLYKTSPRMSRGRGRTIFHQKCNPCIQSMQLQAGDTVTFSRMDPEGKLIMDFRKTTNSTAIQSHKGMFRNPPQ